MKKKICFALTLALCLAACGDNAAAASRTNTGTSVEDVLAAGIAAEEKTISTPEATSTPTPTATPSPAENGDTTDTAAVIAAVGTEGIDVDLTQLSSTMIYSEVYNMLYLPEQYIGKTIKMEGAYALYTDDLSGAQYHSCIIKDAAACCSQGIEFIPDDPSALPAVGGDVTVVGTFDTYTEGEYLYCTLRGASILP